MSGGFALSAAPCAMCCHHFRRKPRRSALGLDKAGLNPGGRVKELMMYLEASREPVLTLLLAVGAGVAVTTLLAATGGTRHSDADLVAYVGLAVVIGLGARWWAAVSGALILWLFYDGFLVGRHGALAWHGSPDGWRLGIMAAGALGGLLIGRVSRFAAVTAPHR